MLKVLDLQLGYFLCGFRGVEQQESSQHMWSWQKNTRQKKAQVEVKLIVKKVKKQYAYHL